MTGNQKNRLSNFIFLMFFSDNLTIFRYFFSGSNMCLKIHIKMYMLFFLQKAAIF